MLARRLSAVLPSMTLAETLETTRIHRVAGRIGDRTAVVTTWPCRAPLQTIADIGLIGGRQVPTPGEGSRAHHGVLCLEARPEFRRHVLEALRQPLEDGVTKSPPPGRHGSGPVGRAGGSGTIQEDVRVGVIAWSGEPGCTRLSEGGRLMRGGVSVVQGMVEVGILQARDGLAA
jgi:hypothetical protein